MKPRHYLQFSDFSRDEYDYLVERARMDQGRSSSNTSPTSRWSTARWR